MVEWDLELGRIFGRGVHPRGNVSARRGAVCIVQMWPTRDAHEALELVDVCYPEAPKQQRAVMEENENWFGHYIWGDQLAAALTPRASEKKDEKEAKESK